MPNTEGEATDDAGIALQASEDASSSSSIPEGWAVCGTCMWNIDSDGALIIKPIDGVSGELESGAAPWLEQKDDIKSVLVEKGVSAGKSVSGFLQGCANATSIDLRGLGTSQTEDFSSMLKGCSSLTELDLTGLDTSNAFTLDEFFADCKVLSFLDISSFNMKNVASMSWMFEGCHSLKAVKTGTGFSLSGRDSNGGCVMFASSDRTEYSGLWISDCDGKAYDCARVPEGIAATYTAQKWSDNKASNRCGTCVWDVDEQGILTIKPMGDMGEGALAEQGQDDYAAWSSKQGEIRSIKVEGKVVAPRKMDGMFSGYSNLEHADLRGFDTIVEASTMSRLFSGCTSLASLDLSTFVTIYCWDMGDMFSGCLSLRKIVLGRGFSFKGADGDDRKCFFPKLDSDGLTGYWQNEVGETFREDEIPSFKDATYTAQEGERVLDWKTSGTCKWAIDDGALVIKPIDGESGELAEWSIDRNGKAYTPWRERSSEITSVKVEGGVKAPPHIWGMFEGCENMVSADLDGLDVSGATDMSFMFYGCKSLQSLDLSSFDTSNVIDMGWMFRDCSALQVLNVSSFDTSKVTNMSLMFGECSSLQSLDVSHFNTSNTTNAAGMFQECSELRSLDVSSFDISSVTDMDCMFSGCSKLEKLDLSNFGTSSVTSMWAVFKNCSGLRSLDLSAFKTSNVKTMRWMFIGCSSLESVVLASFDTSNVTDMRSMFYGCSSLHTLNLSNFDTSNVTDMSRMFSGCSSLYSLDLSAFDTHNAIEMLDMFPNGSRLESVMLGKDFSFCGTGSERLCSLPSVGGSSVFPSFTGSWVDVATEEVYSGDEIPDKKAATYRAQRKLLESDFTVDAPDTVYSGKAVACHVGSDSLTEGVDYDVAYSNDTNAGTASVSIAGKGIYTGKLSRSFKISPAKITADMISGIPEKMEATGGQLMPELTVTFNGNALEKDKDYTVSYGTNVDPGKGTVTVTAVEGGNFTDSVTVEFDIEKKAEPSANDIGNGRYSYVITSGWYHSGVEGYTGEPISPTLAVCTWRSGDDQLREDVDYVFKGWRDADHRDLGGAPTEIGTYYVVFGGIGDYTGTLEGELKIVDPTDIGSGLYRAWESGDDGNGDDVLYTGEAVEPDMQVVRCDTGDYLRKGADFDIKSYLDSDGNELDGAPSTVGEYTVVLAGKGPYTGELERTIYVRPRNSLHFAKFSFYDKTFACTGEPIDLGLEVTSLDGVELEEGADYRILYSSLYDWRNAQPDAPSAVGDYRVTVEALDGGRCVDSVSWIYVSIRDVADIGDADAVSIDLANNRVPYTGDGVWLDIDIKDLKSNEYLDEGEDYELKRYVGIDRSYDSADAPTEVGSYEVVVEGKGLYKGEARLSFEIVPAQMTSVEAFVEGVVGYSGARLEPEPVVSFGGKDLEKGKDYEVSYGLNVDVGEGEVKVSGKGNFTGERNLTFKIVPAEMTACKISGVPEAMTYSGAQLTPEPRLEYGTPLEKGVDYDVVYGTNIDAGQGMLKIIGKGNFTGELNLSFRIDPKQVDAPRVAAGLVYSGEEQTGVAASNDYAVTGGSATNAGSYTATVSLKDLSNCRWADDGSNSDKVFTYQVLPAQLTAGMVSGVPETMEATGEQLRPEPAVTFGGKALVKDKDYTVSYGDNKDPGKGTVTVAAVEGGNFTGSATVQFGIEKKAEPENPDPGTGGGGAGGGTDPAPTPDPGTGGGSGGGGGAPAPEPQQFSVSYHLDGGVNAASNPVTYTAGTAVALADPTKEGYEFQGWYADAALTKRMTEIPADASGDMELWAKWKKKGQEPAPVFPDVDYSESSWYGKAVTYVAEKGLITGYTAGDKAGQFGVGDTLTRAQLATILWRNACPEDAAAYDPASAKNTTGIAGSADGQYYTAAANWAVVNGVISGYDRPDGSKDFAADDDVTFEQLVTILARLCATDEELASAGADLSAFADGADASSWSRVAFAWAASKGLVEGYDTASGKLLAPGEDVARERVAVVLMRAFETGILK